MLERNKWFRQGYKADYAANGLIDRHTTAALLGVTPRTLQRWHNAGIGPKRVPGPGWLSVLYRRSEVEQWKSAKVQTPAISGHQTAEQQDVQTPAFNGHQTAEQQDVQTPAFNGHQTSEQQDVQTPAISGHQTAEQQDVQTPAFNGHQTSEQQDVQTPAISGHQIAEQVRMPPASNSY
jgi:hypothetical protein